MSQDLNNEGIAREQKREEEKEKKNPPVHEALAAAEVVEKSKKNKVEKKTDEELMRETSERIAHLEEEEEEEEKGEVRRQRYLRFKKRVAEIEPSNYTKLFFIWQKGIWYRAFGHSAVIYHYEIAPKIKRKSKLLVDSDYGLKIPGGVVNVREMDELEERLRAIGIKLIDGDRRYKIFNLGKRYTDAEIKYMEERKDEEWLRINTTIVPNDIFPHMHKLLRELVRQIYFLVAKMDLYAKQVMGIKVVQNANRVLEEYSLMSKSRDELVGGKSPESFLVYVSEEMYEIQAHIAVFIEMRVIEQKKAGIILGLTGKIIREAKACGAKRAKK